MRREGGAGKWREGKEGRGEDGGERTAERRRGRKEKRELIEIEWTDNHGYFILSLEVSFFGD